jgi:adenylate cyclase
MTGRQRIARLTEAIVGDPRHSPLELRLFNSVSLLNAVANLGGAIGMLGLSNGGVLAALHLGFGFAFLACYTSARRHARWRHLYWPFTGLMLAFVFINAIENAGTLGGAHYYLIPALVIAVILSGRARTTALVVLLFAIATAALVYIEQIHPVWIQAYMTPGERLVDVPRNLLFVQLFTAAIVLVLARDLNLERAQSERLLLNVLPVEIARELRQTDRVVPREYESASVLFTDFVGFTQSAEHLTPAQLIEALDSAFARFDACIRRHGLEKIKTIGDAYMAVGGIPQPNGTHALDCVRAALEIRDAMLAAAADGSLPPWRIRIGVHTGPLVAGVIGREKFAYDVWGDTVNTASRMESSGEPDRVNVSMATWERVQEHFTGTLRGRVAAKNKGAVEMVFVDGPRSPATDP